MKVVLSYKRDAESKDDHQLAVLELASLAKDQPKEITHAKAKGLLKSKKLPFIHAGQRIYLVDIPLTRIEILIRRLAFWDYLLLDQTPDWAPEDISSGKMWSTKEGVVVFPTQSQVMEWTAYLKDSASIIAALKAEKPLETLADLGEPFIEAVSSSKLNPISRRKNEYLTHGFHKYKAKFFPRLARSLINITCPDDKVTVLDPYCGSGTTGVESLLMGIKSIQFDLDPLSAFIAKTKSTLNNLNFETFKEDVSRLPQKISVDGQGSRKGSKRYQLPRFLLERNPKKLPPDARVEIESEATAIKRIIAKVTDPNSRALLELAFSHALATKIALRWMGTGDNRFALEIGVRSVYSIFLSQTQYILRKLYSWEAIHECKIVPSSGEVEVSVSDCTKLAIPDGSVDAVVTSPPYLPAASGRETYLRSRAASLMGLELMSEESIHACELQIVGSILAMPSSKSLLPDSVTDLVNWMLPQRERASKAKPTAAYFEKLGLSLREMKRVLKPGGTIALVVSKEHMFYEMTTRKVLRKFDMVEAISQMATEKKYGIGLDLIKVQLLELPKMDFAARPGSRGTYSEAILFLQKPRSKASQNRKRNY